MCTALKISALSFTLCKPCQLTLSKTGTWVKQLNILIMRLQSELIARDAWHFTTFRVISVFVVRNKFTPSGLYQNKQTSALPNKNKKGYQRNANWDSRERKAETNHHYSWRTHNLSISLHRHVSQHDGSKGLKSAGIRGKISLLMKRNSCLLGGGRVRRYISPTRRSALER